MIDHLTLAVNDLASTKDFYTKAFKPFGYTMKRDYGEICG